MMADSEGANEPGATAADSNGGELQVLSSVTQNHPF